MDLSVEGLMIACVTARIPTHMHESIVLYVRHGIHPGGFLTAVLSNDLMESVGRADVHNISSLPAYGRLLWNNLPPTSWGSPDDVKAWVKSGGAIGLGLVKE